MINLNKDKCSSCNSSKSNLFWDYDDGTYLCNDCHNNLGDLWAKKHNKPNKSVFGIYLLVVLLSIALIFNINGLITTSNYYSNAQAIDSLILELDDGTIIAKSDYLSMTALNLIFFLALIILAIITIFFLLTKNIIGIYTYLIAVIIAIISNLIYGNIAGAGTGIVVGGYIYRYLSDHPHFNKN